jgi:hypothetical protein
LGYGRIYYKREMIGARWKGRVLEKRKVGKGYN